MRKIAGQNGPYVTGKSTSKSDKEATVVKVEGDLVSLRKLDPDAFCPAGMVVENFDIDPTSGGHGRLTIRCINYGQGDVSTTPTRVTWRISMAEVQTDLKRHPHFEGNDARGQIEAWLATDIDKRYDDNGNPQYIQADGTPHPLTAPATDYLKAYEKGIENYVRHFPVIEKISYYKTLPGCSMIRNSTTSGKVSKFSANIDTWDVPDVTLSGFANTGWFKSGDDYQQGNDLVWTRTEQWTWTPDGSNSETGWIYKSSK